MKVFKTASLVSSLALALTLSLSVAGLAGQGVYGNWKFPQFVTGPLTIDSYLTVAAGQVTAHSTCSMDGKSVSVEVASPAQITATKIAVLAAAQNSVNKDGINCNASVQPSTMDYVVSADDANLTLSVPGQGSMTLPRQ